MVSRAHDSQHSYDKQLAPISFPWRRAKGISMAIASRAPTPHVAEAFMKKLGEPFFIKASQRKEVSAIGYRGHKQCNGVASSVGTRLQRCCGTITMCF